MTTRPQLVRVPVLVAVTKGSLTQVRLVFTVRVVSIVLFAVTVFDSSSGLLKKVWTLRTRVKGSRSFVRLFVFVVIVTSLLVFPLSVPWVNAVPTTLRSVTLL